MPRFEHAPIERHDALAPFSRDHYTGLVQAQRLLKAADADEAARRKAVKGFLDAWDQEIAEHFRDEETLLLPLLDEAHRDQLIQEHQQITAMVDDLREARRTIAPDADLLRSLSQMLDAHIRWEERQLFAHLQGKLTDAQLQTLAQQTAPIEQSRPRNACQRQ